jgi:hypothetical protein
MSITEMRYFQISRLQFLAEEIEEISLHLIIITVVLVYLFLINYAGQEIIDYNDHVFLTA